MPKQTTVAAHRRGALGALLLMAAGTPTAAPAQAVTYYVAAQGSDRSDGRSPRRPWRSVERVNSAELKPGDAVLFRRGDSWRGSLTPRSGKEGAPIRYAAYGSGAKPCLMGSVARSSPADWRSEGDGLWSTGGHGPEKPVPMPPADAAERTIRWVLYTEGGAEASGAGRPSPEAPAAFRVDCRKPGTEPHHLQLYTTAPAVRVGATYAAVLRLRSDRPLPMQAPELMRDGPPWTGLSGGFPRPRTAVGPDAVQLVQYYRAAATDPKPRLTFYLGGLLPAGAAFTVERLSFRECDPGDAPPPSPFSVDVGNLILGDEVACGVKRWTRADLRAQGDFWYDPERQMLWLKCDVNPVQRYGRIECAMYRHIINQSERSYVTYEELALKYGGAHGIGGAATHHIIVRGCDISYIGGADQMGGNKRVRFGNGIEFWAGAHDNLVERCRLWEIYDAALTNQSMGDPVTEADITYRDNVIWNSEYSFEYWNRPETSTTRNIRFINNTCVDAGHGWGHAQRPDPSGCHLRFYESPARAQGIEISGNLYVEATGPAFYAPAWPTDDVRALRMERNVWVQRRGTMISVAGRDYPMEAFARYQSNLGLDRGSMTVDPRFVNPGRRDFRLRPDSPCPGLGARTSGDK